MCVFTVHTLFPFSHSLGSIPLNCVYLCNLAHINSILETNSNCMFSFSLLKASDSHKVLLCFFQGYQQVMRKSVTPHFQENAARSIGSVSCWHCQIDMYVGSASVSWCPLVSPQLVVAPTRLVPHWAPMAVLPPLVLPGWGCRPKLLLWVTESWCWWSQFPDEIV